MWNLCYTVFDRLVEVESTSFLKIFWHLLSLVQVFNFFFWENFIAVKVKFNLKYDAQTWKLTSKTVESKNLTPILEGKIFSLFIVHCHDNPTWKIINKRHFERDANKRFINFNSTAINFVISLISTEPQRKPNLRALMTL